MLNQRIFNKDASWHWDDEMGLWLRDTIHHMGRRCANWNYYGKGTYLITLVLNDRRHPLLGKLAADRPEMLLSELGRRVERHVLRISEFSPELQVLGVQLMPDHLHMILRVVKEMRRSLGMHLRGFKAGATKIALELGVLEENAAGRGCGLFADGFVDTILFDEKALENGLAYIKDNPRRLWEKRSHPELFRVVRDVEWFAQDWGMMHFSGIGNHNLLSSPVIMQVQCSRLYFQYAYNEKGEPQKDAPPAVVTPQFRQKAEMILAAAAHGAVLVNPCISHGEREIARRAFLAGHKVIVLANKGFSPLYKPGGKLFEQCAKGNLLMLAPFGWPYMPGKKTMTRQDACVLNRIAQLLAGNGAVQMDYHCSNLGDIDDLVAQALRPALGGPALGGPAQ